MFIGTVTCQKMRELERKALSSGVSAEFLMEEVGLRIASAILRRYSQSGRCVVCIGSGNNGGDALVAARFLAQKGWEVEVKQAHTITEMRALPRKKYRELKPFLGKRNEVFNSQPLVLLDGLLGISTVGALRAPLRELAEWMNSMRQRHGADIIAMDIPSGINADTGEVYEGAVIADLTLAVAVPKVGLFAQEAVNHVGALEAICLEELKPPEAESVQLNDRNSLSGILPRRPHDFHKGNAGRLGILAGSVGMLGAAVLCARGAIRAGAGLVTVFVYEDVYPLLAPMMPPEVMVSSIKLLDDILDYPLDALVMGPGIGSDNEVENKKWKSLLKELEMPLVLDADALNRLANEPLIFYLKNNDILTPHPREMARLFPEAGHIKRLSKAKAFTECYPGITLLLKGARSIIARNEFPCFVNGSGHSGMASGGQGDVLTGVIGSLLAQKIPSFEAARLGAWMCGRAAELAVNYGTQSYESLCATDVTDYLGVAMKEI